MSDQPTEPTPNLPPPPTTPPVAPAGPPPVATGPPASGLPTAAADFSPGAAGAAPASPAKPPRPRPAIGLSGPSWIRPAFYYVACLLGILLGAWGALNTAQGAVHFIAPDIAQQGDPITRFATTAVNLIDAGITAAEDEFDDEIEESGGEEALEAADVVLQSTRDELRSQARRAAVDEFIGGLIFLAVGFGIYRYHWLRVEPETEPPPAEAG